MTVRPISLIVRDWFEARPEYATSKPTSVARLIAKSVTLEEALASVTSSVRSAIGSVSRGEGLNAIKDGDGLTVYIDPIDLPLFDFVHEYLVPQKKRQGVFQARIRTRCSEWVAAHPEAGLSEAELYEMGDEEETG